MNPLILWTISFLMASSLCQAEEGHHKHHHHKKASKEHKAHLHGHGKLYVAAEKNKLVIAMEVPGHDIVGFENKPKNKKQRATAEKSFQLLSDSSKNIELPSKAECSLKEPEKVQSDLIAKDSHKHSQNKKGSIHSEFEVEYLYSCKNMEYLTSIKVLSFQLFKGMKKLKAQAVTPKGQFSTNLQPKTPTLRLEK